MRRFSRFSNLLVLPYAEYTFRQGDMFSLIAGVTLCVADRSKVSPAPRITVRYQPFDALVLRANGGRGVRLNNPIVDNIGILSTGKRFSPDALERTWEDSWTYGGNATVYFSENTYLSMDFFRTRFVRQLLLDRESAGEIVPYTLDGQESWSNNYQIDISTEPVERLTFALTARYTDARAWQPSGQVREVPMASRFKGVEDLKISLEDKTVAITFNPAKTDEETLAKAIEKCGYTAEKITG